MTMNRKQRRLQEKKSGKGKSKTPANKKAQENAARAAELKAEGMALKNAGKEAEAIPLLKEALALDSSLADVHFALAMIARTKPGLGVDMGEVNECVKDKKLLQKSYQTILLILRNRKQYDEAMIGQEELCRLIPEDNEEQVNFALLLAMADRKTAASIVMARLMKKEPKEKRYKAMFVSICSFVQFMHFDPDVKDAVQTCFDNIYEANLLKIYSAWISLIQNDPQCSGIKEAEKKITDENFVDWIENAEPESLNFFQSKFFLDGIRLLIIADTVMETFLVRMRKWLCLNAETLAKQKRLEFFEPFLLALAEQCFFNEYVFAETPEEKNVIDAIEEQLHSETETYINDLQAFALIGCYRALFSTFPDKRLILEKWAKKSKSFAHLTKTQFFDLEEEKSLKKNIRTFGIMENQVSKDVQSQYEENPYPRWISVINFRALNEALPAGDRERLKARSILIAGCGTGRQAIDTAANYPHAKITAIDLSRASLAYAQRKANESGLADKIEFVHADILSMEQWKEQFDVIECSGVMHHMEDPFKGWRILTDKLKPGGFFKVGLYSETARKAYVEGQSFAKENGFPSTLEGIRTFRERMMALPSNNGMRKLVTGSSDFYTASLVRDLIFHVQEHRMSLPQIKDMMDRLSLECVSFVISDIITIKRYDKAYPDDPDRKNMMNWHEFEKKHPLTFIGMYQFWCRKAG